MDQITPIISISTSFLQRRCPDDGYAMMAKARELGYKYVELGHSLPVTLIDGIVKAVGEGVVKICSLHNFCPVPVYALGPTPNLFSPSTKNAGESSQWQRYTRNTVELAGQLGARAVVAHSGALSQLFFNPGRKLGKYLDGAPISQFQPTPQFQKDVEKFRAKTAERAMAKDYKFLAKNLEEISDFCVERGLYSASVPTHHIHGAVAQYTRMQPAEGIRKSSAALQATGRPHYRCIRRTLSRPASGPASALFAPPQSLFLFLCSDHPTN